jgi:hypothetical protein
LFTSQIDVKGNGNYIAAITSTSTTNNDNRKSNISCYYCPFQTDITKAYEAHVVLKHRNKPAYPGKADMQSLGVSPKGNKWEAKGEYELLLLAPASY